MRTAPFWRRQDKTQVSHVDQVYEIHASTLVLLGNADHEPQAAFHKALHGLPVPLLSLPGKGFFFLSRQQLYRRDLLEIPVKTVLREVGAAFLHNHRSALLT